MIVVDMEFAGNDAERNSIVSLGAVDFNDPTRTLYLECRLREGSEYDDEAALIHGLSREYLNGLSLTEEQLLIQFRDWALKSKSHLLAGLSPMKDFDNLWRGFQRYSIPWVFGYRLIDVHSICVAHIVWNNYSIPLKEGLSALSLDAVSQYVGLPRREGAHNALMDAKLAAECLSRLLHDKPLLQDFSKYPMPKLTKKFGTMY